MMRTSLLTFWLFQLDGAARIYLVLVQHHVNATRRPATLALAPQT